MTGSLLTAGLAAPLGLPLALGATSTVGELLFPGGVAFALVAAQALALRAYTLVLALDGVAGEGGLRRVIALQENVETLCVAWSAGALAVVHAASFVDPAIDLRTTVTACAPAAVIRAVRGPCARGIRALSFVAENGGAQGPAAMARQSLKASIWMAIFTSSPTAGR